MTRLVSITLDSAERSFLLQLANDGHLPVIAGLLDRGTWCPLRTPVPYRSEYATTEFLTGRSAEQNRYWSTVSFDPATYDCITVGAAARTPFYAGLAPRRVITFDLPHAILDPDVAGVQVVGWAGHDARFQFPRCSVPAGLMREIDTRFGPDSVMDVEYRGSWHQESYLAALADALITNVRRRGDIALWLMDRFPEWDLFLMGMPELHSAGHTFSHGVDPDHLLGMHPTASIARARFLDVYGVVDETIGRILAARPDDTSIALVAPNGMQPDRDDVASDSLLPEFLYRRWSGRAYVDEPTHRSWARRGHPPVWPDPRRFARDRLDQLAADGRLPGLKRRFHAAAPRAVADGGRRLHRATRGLLGAARPPTPDRSGPQPEHREATLLGSIDWHPAMRYQHWWPDMPWFVLPGFSDGHIRVNVRGRERNGIVALDDYAACCDELEATLRECRDPRTGGPAVDRVFRLRADDPLDPEGPGADLVVTWLVPLDAMVHPDTGMIGPLAFPRSGSHTPNGFLLAAGAGIPRATLDERPGVDVAPTLLALLGAPIPSRLTGAPIVGASSLNG